MPYSFTGRSPAARLEELLILVSKHEIRHDQMAQFLAKLFGVEIDSSQFALLCADILKNIEECKIAVARIPGANVTRYVPIFEQASTLFLARSIFNNVDNAQAYIKNTNLLTLLGLCTETFEQHGVTDQVERGQIEQWHSQIAALTTAIGTDEGIDTESRTYLVALLESLNSALIAHRLGGAKALRDQVDLVIARLLKVRANLPKESQGAVLDAINNIADVVKQIDGVLSSTVSAYEKVKILAIPTGMAIAALST